MRISVVIPCHNAEPYLAQTLGSTLDQRHVPDEIIVVDDGSTDGSLGIARRFEDVEAGRVRVLSERCGRASRVRNIGALVATGDALMFLDADDVLDPGAIEALATALEAQPAGVAVCPWFRLESVEGRWLQRPASCQPRLAGQDALAAWLRGWYHPPCSVLWSREGFEAAGRWDERATVNDDGDLMMRALANGVALVEASGGAGYYRRRADGSTSLSSTRLTREAVASRLRTLEKIGYLLEDAGELERHREAFQRAVGFVALDARGRHDDLHERARALGRRFGLSWRGRLRRRAAAAGRAVVGRRREGPGSGGSGEQAVEVRWGLDHAARVLRSASASSDDKNVRVGPRFPKSFPSTSVVIPTYNRAQVLPRTLASVSAQTFDDFEVLVVDDGSTDETGSVLAAYPDCRVRYLRQPCNLGVSAARNRGLREARGQLIAFLDSDDEWLPRKLERQVALFREANDQLGLVYTGVQSVREDGTTTVERPVDRGDVHREMLWRNVIHGGGSNVMIRREAVAAVGFFHEGLSAIEDYEYWLRITRFFRVDFVDEPLIRYHDPRGWARRSRALQANLDARWWLYRRHAAEMRRAGVAHLFLVNTIRWVLQFPEHDRRVVRRLAARAVIEKPISRIALAMFLRTMLPAAGHLRWVRRHAAVE